MLDTTSPHVTTDVPTSCKWTRTLSEYEETILYLRCGIASRYPEFYCWHRLLQTWPWLKWLLIIRPSFLSIADSSFKLIYDLIMCVAAAYVNHICYCHCNCIPLPLQFLVACKLVIHTLRKQPYLNARSCQASHHRRSKSSCVRGGSFLTSGKRQITLTMWRPLLVDPFHIHICIIP